MPGPFVVAFAVGVTPGKWARAWGERMPEHPLTLTQLSPSSALAALRDGTADVALLRLPLDHDDLSVIPLYEELPVVVVPKDHVIEALESVTVADLAGETALESTVLDGEWASAVELVVANVGVAVMPQSVARALSRRDVVARPVTDAPSTRIALAWLTSAQTPEVDEFIGIVRGRTANSSRGQKPTPEPIAPKKPKPEPKKRTTQQRRKSGRGR